METMLSVTNLVTRFETNKGVVTAVDGVDFSVGKGRILGIVGESGCGKSVTSLSILKLLPREGKITSGEILLDGKNLLTLDEKECCKIRGNEIAMIFQDPMSCLNPVYTIERQMMEPFMIHQGKTKHEARQLALEMLQKVRISSPEQRLKEYPHQLSGGMRQRIMIAMALSCNPKLLIADEPTTALDVTIQAQILYLMRELRNMTGTSIILITHDMGVAAEMADDIFVMYAGKGVEYGSVDNVYHHPKHPYTQGLLKSIPRLDEECEELYTIKGSVPSTRQIPTGCRFEPRCPYAMPKCRETEPDFLELTETKVRCFLYEKEVEKEMVHCDKQ